VIALLGDGVPGVLDAISALPAGSGLANTDYNLVANYVWGKWLNNALDPTLTADQALTVAANYAITRGQTGTDKRIGDPNFHVESQSHYTCSSRVVQ
jgi:hypothetical protein